MASIPANVKKSGILLQGPAVQQVPVVLTSRQYLWLIGGICSLMGLLVVPWITTLSPDATFKTVAHVFWSLSLTVVLQMGVNYYLRYNDNAVRHWLDYQPLWANMLLRLSILLAAAAVFGISKFYLTRYFGAGSTGENVLSAVAGSQIFAFLIAAIQVAVETLERSQFVASENDQLRQEQLQARYESLKQQLSPHFLFNSLTTLTGLIWEEPATAAQFVEEMAVVYRYLLQHGEQPTVALHEEIDFLQSYFYLLQRRFGESLQLDIQLPNTITDRMLPPLALQLLVENAVKHNVLARRQPLQIAIEFVAPDTLLVRNNRQPRLTAEPSSGIGLSNLISRIRILHHRKVTIEKSVDEFRVYVPLPA